ncbi:cation:proton antiporter [Micromonospora zingiberis]|uniref:Cation:proton antiporter n=1 Tax=Micromonospora zingiberis TaxID=2053011 RepID=A0A4R0GBH8_9ACTN|nr:cation:proton antiporter [Micromonospora zingiberis]TCB94430.1 cation:proton antiporter [Micromonospora zingiberis]
MLLAASPTPPIGAHSLLVLLLQIGLLLLLALLLGRLANRLGLPAIVGELSAGVLIGPSVLAHALPGVSGWLFPTDPAQFHMLDAVGQLGVLLLLGITGMHMDLSLVRRRGTTVAKISIAGILIPLGLGVWIGFLLPAAQVPDSTERLTFALFLGVAMGVSAIPVIAKTLMELRLLHRNIGQLTISAVVIDDIAGWILLSVVSAMATVGVRGGDLALTIAGLIGIIVAARLLRAPVGAVLRRFSRSPDNGPLVAAVTVLIILGAAGTHALRLEAVFGALVVGILITSTGAVDPARLAPLRITVMSVLAPLFFATAGLRMDLTALADPQILVIGLVVLFAAIAGKFIGAYLGARLSRLTHWEGLALGAGMNARGVIEVIIAMVGLRLGVLTPAMYTIIVLVAVVTSLMAPPLLRLAMARVENTAEERLRENMYDANPSTTSR